MRWAAQTHAENCLNLFHRQQQLMRLYKLRQRSSEMVTGTPHDSISGKQLNSFD
jgi:hypothetical protein